MGNKKQSKKNQPQNQFKKAYRKNHKEDSVENTHNAKTVSRPKTVSVLVTDENRSSILRKIIIMAEMESKSPLRIGSQNNDDLIDILVLKDKNGQSFIPGTSIAGVLRAELEAVYDSEPANKLFGYEKDVSGHQSLITVNDIVLKNTELVYRDGVSIDSLTGTAIKQHKFDYEAIERGARGELVLEMTIRYNDVSNDELPRITYLHKDYEEVGDVYGELAATICDLLTQWIHLGALTTKGFGKIRANGTAMYYDFLFADNKKAAGQWLDYISDGKLPIACYSGCAELVLVKDDFKVDLDCALHSSLLIADDVDYEMNGDKNDTIAAVQLKSRKQFVIPGTSLKGVLRNRALQILLKLNNNQLDKAEGFLNTFMGYSIEGTGDSQKSNLSVEEVYIDNDHVKPVKQHRIRIDRFTGSVMDGVGALFTVEPIWQQDKDLAPVHISFNVKKCSRQQAGLMLLLIKDLWLGNLAVGSGKGIGRGILNGRLGIIHYDNKVFKLGNESGGFTVAENGADLAGYVQELVGGING